MDRAANVRFRRGFSYAIVQSKEDGEGEAARKRARALDLRHYRYLQGDDRVEGFDLRKVVRGAGGSYHVVKNKLAAKASEGTKIEAALKGLKGVSSVAYTSGDPVALAKALSAWVKDNSEFTFKLGIVEGKVITAAEVNELATMPGKEELYAKLLWLIQSPAQRLATVVNATGRDLAVVINQGVEQEKFSVARLRLRRLPRLRPRLVHWSRKHAWWRLRPRPSPRTERRRRLEKPRPPTRSKANPSSLSPPWVRQSGRNGNPGRESGLVEAASGQASGKYIDQQRI